MNIQQILTQISDMHIYFSIFSQEGVLMIVNMYMHIF